MNREQMELFDQAFVTGEELPSVEVHSAQIIPLPIDPNLVFIRLTARCLERRDGARADRLWRMECNRLYAKLQVQGIAEDEIRGEIRRFVNAVHEEMQRAAWAEQQNNNPKPTAWM